MKKTKDIVAEFPGLVILHQKIPSHEVGRHQHDEHEFFLPLQGEIAVTYGEQTVKAGPGKMLYVPPKLDHSFVSSAKGSGERVIWLVEDTLWKKQQRLKFQPCALTMNSLAKELVFYLLLHRENAGTRHFITALIETLGDSLSSSQTEQQQIQSAHLAGRVNDPRVKSAMEMMEKNLESPALAEVARKSGLSLRNLNRLFLKEAGTTPKDYLIRRRLDRAKQLLRESRLTVTDIALEVGYQSVSKFIETFKKREGILPSDYRAAAHRS